MTFFELNNGPTNVVIMTAITTAITTVMTVDRLVVVVAAAAAEEAHEPTLLREVAVSRPHNDPVSHGFVVTFRK